MRLTFTSFMGVAVIASYVFATQIPTRPARSRKSTKPPAATTGAPADSMRATLPLVIPPESAIPPTVIWDTTSAPQDTIHLQRFGSMEAGHRSRSSPDAKNTGSSDDPPARLRDPKPPTIGEFVYCEQEPSRLSMPEPLMSQAARDLQLEGTVNVLALIGTDGRVTETRVVKSIPMLDESAVEAVRASRWTPATDNGKPVAVWVNVPVKFGP